MAAGLLEYTVDVGEHVRGFLRRVHQMMDPVQGVVLGQGTRLLVVRFQALLQSLHIIVASSHQRLSGQVVGHWLLGRRKLLVIRSATGLVDQAASDTAHQQTIGDSEFDDRIEAGAAFLQQLIQLRKRLDYGAS